jgi:hypothetical protein
MRKVFRFKTAYEVNGKKISVHTKHSHKLLIKFYKSPLEQNFN